MEVFISWSGDRSKIVAEIFREWLPNVIQTLNPWISCSDIDKGSRWHLDISKKLEKANFGIICLTPENLKAPWLLFEAGALSKFIDETKICPVLLGLKDSDIEWPLAQFQSTKLNKSDLLKLIKSLNEELENDKLSESQLEEAFNKWWPDLDEKLKAIPSTTDDAKEKRSEREMIEEILTSVRSIEMRPSHRSKNLFGLLTPRDEKIIRERVIDLIPDFPEPNYTFVDKDGMVCLDKGNARSFSFWMLALERYKLAVEGLKEYM